MNEIFNKYCAPFTKKEQLFIYHKWLKLNYTKLYDNFSNREKYPFLSKIMNSIDEIKNELKNKNFYNRDNFISACSAFISITFIYCSKYDISTLKQKLLVKYVLLYVFVDHILDIQKDLLDEFKSIFHRIISGENENITSKNENINICTSYLQDIIKESPKAIPFIIQAAKLEFESIEIQNHEHDTLQLCYLKGETSAKAGIAVLTNGDIIEGTDIMGRLGQLYDDIMDVEIDLKYNIQTYAVECLKQNNNLDLLIELLLDHFEKLPPQFSNTKPLMLYCLATFLNKKKYFSPQIKKLFDQYSMLPYMGDIETLFYFL